MHRIGNLSSHFSPGIFNRLTPTLTIPSESLPSTTTTLRPNATSAHSNANATTKSDSKDHHVPLRSAFYYFLRLQTRFADNDAYKHINNVVYYSYFDTIVNHFLIKRCGLNLEGSPTIGIVAETHCKFLESLAYPQVLDLGLAITKLGKSSVIYEIGVFDGEGDPKEDQKPAAYGKFVHVYVDEKTRRPASIPPDWRIEMEKLLRRH